MTALVGDEAVIPSTSNTAYNLFAAQEKQFVMGFGAEDAKTRIGKHCGNRWQGMSKEEKDLYLALHDC